MELLRTRGRLTVDELVADLGISPATARRDLAELESRGLLERNRGGAVPLEPMIYAAFRGDSSFKEQESAQAEEKARIGLAAARLVNDGDVIALTAGTTTTNVARNLHNLKGVTILTNAVNIAMELSRHRDLSVVLTGGSLHGNWFSLVGTEAAAAAKRMFVSKVFLGANGVDPRRGITDFHLEEVAVNRAIVEQCETTIVVADHTKLGVVVPHLVCAPEQVDVLVTGRSADQRTTDRLADNGTEIIKV